MGKAAPLRNIFLGGTARRAGRYVTRTIKGACKMADREKETVVHTDGGGGGGAVIAVVLLIAVIVVLFLLFGGNLFGGGTDGVTDINADVNVDAPAGGGGGGGN
jgi:hypothetical protein